MGKNIRDYKEFAPLLNQDYPKCLEEITLILGRVMETTKYMQLNQTINKIEDNSIQKDETIDKLLYEKRFDQFYILTIYSFKFREIMDKIIFLENGYELLDKFNFINSERFDFFQRIDFESAATELKPILGAISVLYDTIIEYKLSETSEVAEITKHQTISESKKIIWNGNPATLAFFIDLFILKGYINPMSSNTELADILIDCFNFSDKKVKGASSIRTLLKRPTNDTELTSTVQYFNPLVISKIITSVPVHRAL